jgi:hypothetical protein
VVDSFASPPDASAGAADGRGGAARGIELVDLPGPGAADGPRPPLLSLEGVTLRTPNGAMTLIEDLTLQVCPGAVSVLELATLEMPTMSNAHMLRNWLASSDQAPASRG